MKLHLGCGNKYIEGYKHIDIINYKHVDYKTTCDNLYMIEDNSVEEIYACHILEHIGRNENVKVINEWRRVLKPGGVLRIAVPDFNSIVEEYILTKDLNLLIGLLYGGQNNEYNYHYMIYDFKTIKRLLELCGFTNVSRYNWKKFLPTNFDDFSKAHLPHMDTNNGRLMSLNVVCYKKLNL